MFKFLKVATNGTTTLH